MTLGLCRVITGWSTRRLPTAKPPLPRPGLLKPGQILDAGEVEGRHICRLTGRQCCPVSLAHAPGRACMAAAADAFSRSSRYESRPSPRHDGPVQRQTAQKRCTPTTTSAGPLAALTPTRLASSKPLHNPCLASPARPAGRTAATLLALDYAREQRNTYTVKMARQATPLAARAASTARHRAAQAYQRCAGGGLRARSKKGVSLPCHLGVYSCHRAAALGAQASLR